VSTFDFGAVVLVLAAVVGVVNDRTLRLPRPVAVPKCASIRAFGSSTRICPRSCSTAFSPCCYSLAACMSTYGTCGDQPG
jgi:hypothetical protein